MIQNLFTVISGDAALNFFKQVHDIKDESHKIGMFAVFIFSLYVKINLPPQHRMLSGLWDHVCAEQRNSYTL